MEVEPRTELTLEFLRRFQPEGPWALCAINPEKKGRAEVATFYPHEEGEAREWIGVRNGRENLYFHVNDVGGRITSKAFKDTIQRAQWLHVDIDPRPGEDIEEERERARKMLTEGRQGVPPATVVLFSGGGYQGFWRLDAPQVIGTEQAAEEFERYNRRLELVFGADNCHNVDRIMRLPGTVNLPDAKKRQKGRKPALASVEYFGDETYSLDVFERAPPKHERQADGRALSDDRMISISGNVPRLTDLEQLNDWHVEDRIKDLVRNGHLRDQEGPKPKDDSRSAWLFDCLCGLARAGVPEEIIYGIVTDSNYGISQSVIDKGRAADKYARRQIRRAVEFAVDPILCDMNDRFAVIGNMGGKCRVVEEIETEYFVDGERVVRSTLSKQSFEDFRNRHMHELVECGAGKDDEPIRIPRGKWWLQHRERRQYKTIVFAPGRDVKDAYNLWRGFAFDATPGDCSLYLQHLRENICGGDEASYEYLLSWMARGVQDPGTPGQVAVVMRGGMGTGKGVCAKHYYRLFGRHGMQVTSVKHFLGNFNNHLRDCVVLFADEAFFAGDKAHESLLKAIVSEETLVYESKGVDAEQGPNYTHLMMASNSDWVVPLGNKDRRYFVLDVGDAKQQDATFFGAIHDQMVNGGYAALLHMLLERDISNFQVRKYPRTEAAHSQRELTLGPMEEWWITKLRDGAQYVRLDHWEERVQLDKLVDDYVEYSKRFNIARRGNQTQLGRFFAQYVPDLQHSRPRLRQSGFDEHGRETSWSRQVTCLHFPSLDKCRAHFEKVSGATVRWELGDSKESKSDPEPPAEMPF